MNQKKPFIWVTLFFTFCLTQVSLKAQAPIILDSKMKSGIYNDMRIEELKVRWKKSALENCLGVPCVTIAIPGAPTAVVATAGNVSASVSFVAPTNNGGSVVTGYTVTSNPGSFIGTGTTSPINVTGLTNGTAYTFTVVATNAVGNSVASAASTAVTPLVVCPTPQVFDGSGNPYNTVSIGAQCWTKENLKATLYNDGVTPIPDETANTSGWGSLATGARSEYVAAGVTGYVSNYGYLYNWYAAAGIITNGGSPTKNICPALWHVPTETDWTNLINFLGTTPGTKLRENSSLWAVNTGTDQYGFSARPGGWRNFVSWFRFIGTDAFFWTATYDVINNSAVSVAIDGNQDNVFIGAGFQSAVEGYSVRCLRN